MNNPSRFRLKLGQIMALVAILALFFAGYGVKRGSMMAGFFLVLLTPVALVKRERRVLVSAWIMALYPNLISLSLYATYIAGWVSLGRPPRPSLDDPKFIGPLVDFFYDTPPFVFAGLPVSLLGCVALTLALIGKSRSAECLPRRRNFRPLLLLSIWLLGLVWVFFDIFRVFNWYID